MAGSSEVPDSLRMLDSDNRTRGQDWGNITAGHINQIRNELEEILKLDRKARFIIIFSPYIVHLHLTWT